MTKFIKNFLSESSWISNNLDIKKIGMMVQKIKSCKKKQGRIFFLGVGGSAGNASHAVNDFRKIIGIEAYAPTDNVSELTARTNDEGWSEVFIDWLKISKGLDVCLSPVLKINEVEKDIHLDARGYFEYQKTIKIPWIK